MNPIEIKFYKKFWNDNACKSIFLRHRSNLLKKRTLDLELIKQDYFSSEIIISNTTKSKENTKKVVSRIQSESIDVEYNLGQSIQKYLGEEKLVSFVQKKYGRTIKKISKKIEKKGFLNFFLKIIESLHSEKEIVKLTHKFHLTPPEVTDLKEMRDHFLSDLKQEVQLFLRRENISELFFSIDDISKIYDSKLREIIVQSNMHYMNILYENENYTDRRELFEELFELEILKSGKSKSFYECVNCPPNTFSGLIKTNISPKKLNLLCPACQEETFFAVPYEICEGIYKHIQHKDGVLFHALHFLLYDSSIDHDVSLNLLKDIEIDLCLYNNENNITEIIEVKMFKQDRPKDTLISNLRQAFGQIKKVRSKLIREDKQNSRIKYSIVTNIENVEILKETKKQLSKELKKNKTKIYSPDEYKDYIEKKITDT